MNGIVCADLASCQSIELQVDSVLGYPQQGRDFGGGLHAPAWQSATQTYAAPVPLASVGQYGYPTDAINIVALTPAQIASIATLNVASSQQASLG
jgi:hypothetical protein